MANEHTTQPETTPSVAADVVSKIAEREGIEPTELRPLHGVVDPDALNAIFAARAPGVARAGGRVTFPYCGYVVQVHGDGRVHVRADRDN